MLEPLGILSQLQRDDFNKCKCTGLPRWWTQHYYASSTSGVISSLLKHLEDQKIAWSLLHQKTDLIPEV